MAVQSLQQMVTINSDIDQQLLSSNNVQINDREARMVHHHEPLRLTTSSSSSSTETTKMIETESNTIKKLSSPTYGSNSSTISEQSTNGQSMAFNFAFKRHWGEEITVELERDNQKGFGISIIGGKDSNKSGGLSTLTGILIKKILPDSPALKCEKLKTGDRLLEVGGFDLRNATHDQAVEAIKNAISPVKFVVQILIPAVVSVFVVVLILFFC